MSILLYKMPQKSIAGLGDASLSRLTGLKVTCHVVSAVLASCGAWPFWTKGRVARRSSSAQWERIIIRLAGEENKRYSNEQH